MNIRHWIGDVQAPGASNRSPSAPSCGEPPEASTSPDPEPPRTPNGSPPKIPDKPNLVDPEKLAQKIKAAGQRSNEPFQAEAWPAEFAPEQRPPPDLDTMAQAMMTRLCENPQSSLPVEFNSVIRHLVEGWSKERNRVEKLERTLAKQLQVNVTTTQIANDAYAVFEDSNLQLQRVIGRLDPTSIYAPAYNASRTPESRRSTGNGDAGHAADQSSSQPTAGPMYAPYHANAVPEQNLPFVPASASDKEPSLHSTSEGYSEHSEDDQPLITRKRTNDLQSSIRSQESKRSRPASDKVAPERSQTEINTAKLPENKAYRSDPAKESSFAKKTRASPESQAQVAIERRKPSGLTVMFADLEDYDKTPSPPPDSLHERPSLTRKSSSSGTNTSTRRKPLSGVPERRRHGHKS